VAADNRFFENAVIQTALLYQEMDAIDKGIQYMQGIIAARPNIPEFYLYLGSFYEELEQFDKAGSTVMKGLALDDKDARLHFRLGVIYDKAGDKEGSIRQMKRVIALEPDNANALNYLGYTYADLGRNLDEAERLIKEALKHKPDDGYITDSLGWVYYQKGDYKKALAILEKAVELVPDDPVILEHLGDAHLKLEDKQKAVEYYRRSLKQQKNAAPQLEEKIRKLTGENKP